MARTHSLQTETEMALARAQTETELKVENEKKIARIEIDKLKQEVSDVGSMWR